MREEGAVYVCLSPDIDALLADTGTSVRDLLGSAGLSVEQQLGVDPGGGAGGRAKDPVTILLASAAVVAALTPAIKRAIEALSRKSVLVREQVLVPVEDSSGGVVRDSAGEPVMQWVDRSRFVETAPPTQDTLAYSLQGPVGLRIEYSESRTPPQP